MLRLGLLAGGGGDDHKSACTLWIQKCQCLPEFQLLEFQKSFQNKISKETESCEVLHMDFGLDIDTGLKEWTALWIMK